MLRHVRVESTVCKNELVGLVRDTILFTVLPYRLRLAKPPPEVQLRPYRFGGSFVSAGAFVYSFHAGVSRTGL